MISFLSESILITYNGSLSETLIPFLCPIVKFTIPSWTPITLSLRSLMLPFLESQA